MARPAGAGGRTQPTSPPYLRSAPDLRAREKKRGRRATRTTISARLASRVTLETHASGKVIVYFDGRSVDLGAFSAGAANRAQDLRIGLPLTSFASSGR